MNCDQVFDVLTRGPFPTGTACDTPVEAHLRVCPECHRLAEALRPALELFQEAISPEESRDLPGYWCAVGSERSQPLVSYAQPAQAESERRLRQPARSQPATRGLSPWIAWGLAAALALGVTLGSLVNTPWSLDGYSSPAPAAQGNVLTPPRGGEPAPLAAGAHKFLASLPAACFRHQPGRAPKYTVAQPQVLRTADLANLACCTECHNAHSDSVSSYATAAVSQSCRMCHQESLVSGMD